MDRLTPWLLRLGIDHSGRLSLNLLWDVAIRATIVADLLASGRLVAGEDRIEVDPAPTGPAYEDEACRQLLDGRTSTELAWIRTGRLKAASAGQELVRQGEWSQRWAPLQIGLRQYRAPKQQHIQLTNRLAHTVRREMRSVTEAEAALAVLGHALGFISPDRRGNSRRTPLTPDRCGSLASIVGAAVTEIQAREALSQANSDPTVG